MRYERRNPSEGGSCAPHKGLGKAVCDVTKTSTQILNQAAATTFTLQMQLQRCNCFWPCSVRIWGLDNAAASTDRAYNLQQVEVNGCAQECGSLAALAVGALNIIGTSRDYTVPDTWYGVPVCWSPWCRQAFAEANDFGFENIDVAAIDIIVTQWGMACPAVPPGLTCGKPPGAAFT